MNGETLRKAKFKGYINDFFEGLELYDDYKNDHNYKSLLQAGINVFLDHETDFTAKEIYETFFMIYQITPENKSEEKHEKYDLVSEQNNLLELVNIMEKYEKYTGELIERQRDHFIHSVNVFLLGLAVYSQNKHYRDVFRDYIKRSKYEKYYKTADGELSDEEFLYRWGIAALFHDIGYPFEIIGKQLNKFINDGVKSISNTYDIDVGIDFKDFNEFNSIVKLDPYDFADNYRANFKRAKVLDLFKPTEILAHKISNDFNFTKEQFKNLTDHLNQFIYYMKENNFIDHGFFSAILVLNSYGSLIQKYSKNKDFFFYPIVDSSSAILLHNYYNKTMQEDPFNLSLLAPESNPIAFLLILCDELQEWNRQPYGVLDVKKFHVNDLIIEIDDERMDVEYILKFGSMGLGFSKDKKQFINSVLDLESLIFKKGLSVVTDVKPDVQESVMRDIDMSEIQAPNILIRNLEDIAIQINDQYNQTTIKEYNEKKDKNQPIDEELQYRYDNLCDFKDLDYDLKLSNIRQARSIPKKLNMIGCEIANSSDKRAALTPDDFTEKEILDLAIFEHNDWCKEKEGTGWVYGDKKDNEKHTSPYLVPWDELDEDTKKYDKESVKEIPKLLESIGLKVVRSKIRLLTFKMHEFYENGVLDSKSDAKDLFYQLPDYVQYSNYKQANFIVKILKERGYELVNLSDRRDAIDFFSMADLDHFAEREHYGWYMLKFNLGWSYGPSGEKTSPNLVPWEKLSDNVKEANKRTFKNLPEICKDPNVGLKIVRSE